jgi:general secretion pathway protein J
MIALVIFATLSMLAYGGLNTILKADEKTRYHTERLTMLQRGWMLLGEDLTQLVGRSVRDNYGDEQGAIRASEIGVIQLEFTRGGRSNPMGLKRSELQRVGYGVVDGKLLRYSWQVLDRAQDSEPRQLMLLDEVMAMSLRFLDKQKQWHQSWPPMDDKHPSLPMGIEVTLELNPEGEIRRLFRTVGEPWS